MKSVGENSFPEDIDLFVNVEVIVISIDFNRMIITSSECHCFVFGQQQTIQ